MLRPKGPDGVPMRIDAMLLVLCLATVPVDPGNAGPWLRPEGESFLSVSVEKPDGDQFYLSTYGEYGLRPDLTLGLDFGVNEDELDKAILFAKRPLSSHDSAFQVSLELGMGVVDEKGVLRPGVNIGHSYVLRDLNGWISLELKAVLEPDDGDHFATTDLTIGLEMSARHKAMLQISSTGSPVDGDSLKITPSFVFERTPGHHFQIGVTAGIRDDDNATAIKLGIWREF